MMTHRIDIHITGRRVLFAALLAVLGAGSGGTFPAKAADNAPAADDGTDAYVLRVDGLACPYCAYGIEKQFDHLAGVTDTDVDLARGAVVVHVTPGTRFERAQLEQTVKDSGFTLRRVIATPSTGR